MLKIVQGDLLTLAEEGQFSYIMHGCNCFCTMGAGIAVQIAKKYPIAAKADRATITGDLSKLGNYNMVPVMGKNGKIFTVINAYTQYHPGPDFRAFALESVLWKFTHLVLEQQKAKEVVSLGVPWIGCGIGGGEQKVVKAIFKDFSKFFNITIVEYKPMIP